MYYGLPRSRSCAAANLSQAQITLSPNPQPIVRPLIIRVAAKVMQQTAFSAFNGAVQDRSRIVPYPDLRWKQRLRRLLEGKRTRYARREIFRV
jgi:hypothetical protein